MKIKDCSKRICAMILVFAISAANLTTGFATGAGSEGIGDVKFKWNREIYQGVNLTHLMSENSSGTQKVYTTEFNPTTAAIKPVLNYGDYVMGGDIMSDMVSQVEQSGDKVVFAINGDAYDTSNGVSNGIMIQNGLLISTSNGSEGVGFREDGSVIYGPTSLNITAAAGDTSISVTHVNKERKLDTEGVYLLTEQFDKATRSTQAGVEVVLDVTTSGYKGLVIGGQVTAKVLNVNQVAANPDKNSTGILPGQIVLSANSASSRYAALSALASGQEITIDVQNANAEVDWGEAAQALGIFHILVKDGQVNTPALSDPAVHPRTVFGTRQDGTVVLLQCDGRQPGFADGVTFQEIVEYMTGIGCVNVFNFDGGGSSTLTATLPGDQESTILNRPSDGQERANCNALLFVAASDAVEGNPVEKLHIYPDIQEGYGTKVNLLENGKMRFKVGATDNNYHYADGSDTRLAYSAEGGIGDISQDGVLTASAGAHQGKVKVSTQDGSVHSEIQVNTVDAITKLTADRSIVSVAPGKTTQLNFTAENNGVPVVLTSEALSFQLSDESLGTISQDGIFTAADTQGTGSLTISYKDYRMTLPVEIGKLPVLINDFETSLDEAGWMWRYTNPQNGGSGSMSINYDERFVKTGDGSLRIDYDFATKPVTGTIAVETGPKDQYFLEGQPKAIGCWVYGDGNGAWLRIQLAPATYVGDTYVDWVGWKYIETEIPTTAQFPYELKYGVRLLCTPTTPVQNKKGTIYIDGLRAVYDFKNDDTLAPELLEGTDVAPVNGAVDVDHQPDISITVKDPQKEGEAYTGINTDRTKLWINGKEMSNVLHETQPDGSVKISYIPSALTRLRSGLNKVKYRVEDNAGNKFFKEWSFHVEGYNVNLEETKPAGEKASAGSTFDYIINANDYKKFEEFQFELSYNPLFVSLEAYAVDDRVTVVKNEVDEQAGSVKFTLQGMKDVPKDEDHPLVKMRFKVSQASGGQTGIQVHKAVVRETGEVEGTNLILDGYDQEIDFKYTLSWTGSTHGKQTAFKLIDRGGTPVAAMGLKVALNGEEIPFGERTDEQGQLVTGFFGKYPVGTNFSVWVEDASGALGNLASIPVFDSLGAAQPSKIVVTTGENPATGVGISWETSLGVSSGEVIVGKQNDLSDGMAIAASGKDIITSLNGFERIYQAWGATVNDLEPSTIYYYKVGQGSEYSEIKSFKTAPESGDLTIAFYGDIQGSYNKFPQTIESLKALYPEIDLSLLAGDVSDNGHIYSDWSAIDSGFGSNLSSGIWAATIGNHDSYFDAQTFSSFFNGPANGTYFTPRNYSFEIGDMVVYNLDTEAVYSYDPDFSGQIAKMREVFSNSDKTYKVVLMHRSAYPMNYDEADVRELHRVFDELKVDVVLSGHDHIYSRTEMRGGQKTSAGNGTQYVVGGSSSGSKFYTADSAGREWQDIVYDDDNPVFTVLKVRDGKLGLEAYAIEGGASRLIDSFEITKHQASFDPGQIEGPSKVTDGSTVTYTVKIPEGQMISRVTVNGNPVVLDGNRFTLENIKEDLVIQVAFVPSRVDKTILEKVIGYAQQQIDTGNTDNLIPAVQAAFVSALGNANTVFENQAATQEQVDQAWVLLMKTIHMFDFVKGDKTALNELITLCGQLNLDDYQDTAAFIAALRRAEEVAKDENALADEIDTARGELQSALDALVLKDTTQLKVAVAQAEKISAELDRYVDTGKEAFSAAYKKAGSVLENPKSTQQEIDLAVQGLLEAMLNLRYKADKTLLQGALADAALIDLSGYTGESVKAFHQARDYAAAILADEMLYTDQDQLVVDNAARALQEAIDGLEPIFAPNRPVSGDSTVQGSSAMPKTGDASASALALILLASAGVMLLKKRRR